MEHEWVGLTPKRRHHELNAVTHQARDEVHVAAQSVQELRAVADDDSLWKAEWRHARVLAATGRQVASRELYLAAVATVDRLRRAPLGYRLESTFFADKAPLLDDAIRLTAQLDDARTCLQLIERVKSRALTAILTVPTATPDGEETLAAAIDGVSTQLDALEYERYRLGWDPDSHARRERLLADRAGLLERIQLQDPRWRSLTRQAEFDPAETIGSLAATNRAAISLYYRGGIVTAVSIANGGLAVAAHPLSPATIAAIAEYATNLQRDRPIRERYDPAYTAALDAESLIPRTLLEGAVGSGGLVVIPHGELHLLPWGAVTYRGQRLFERLEVTVLPNAACLSLLGRPRGGAGGVALLGAPDQTDLPGLAPLNLAADEILAVEGILGARVFAKETGRSATQARYRSLIGDPRGQGGILHLACHGDFVADAPENSGLLLADGKLDASDIARHRIQFDEVVLSACASGYRPTRVGDLALAADDVIGLPGAFLEAGARSVVVSIPPARDAAALDLMTRYYEFRSDAVPTGRALQQAQIAIQRARTLPAHLWAGFTLYGVGT